ncbi:MAG: glycogen synthase GlgA [Verrucomicrobia bacterium]|nr:glycogen synthase GlgA [Verrucomicrobiota bacterium]
MRILLASSEVHPYSKTGGLADMAAALAKFLGRAGHRVGVVTPLYRGVAERFASLQHFDWHLDLPLGAQRVRAEVFTLEPSENVTFYFIKQPPFYDRPCLYNERDLDYPDNPARFIYFAKCVANLARYLPWKPQILHGHDWQAGVVPLLVLHQKTHEGWWDAPRTCHTIHNLAYQGNCPLGDYTLTNLPPTYLHAHGAEFYGRFSLLKTGIAFADVLTTVSPRYAIEITTPRHGCGLDGALRARRQSLVGVLNGVDYDEWNTEHNRYLKHPYSARNLQGKAAEKASLQQELRLPPRPDVPLFAAITRLAHQKGIDLLLGALMEMLASDIQFVLLGTGQPSLEHAFRHLASRYPHKTAIRIAFDQGLSHRIEAGADFFLMPSAFEPCGLNQMYSLRYGTLPIVRTTGGLDDTVVDISEDRKHPTGIKFTEYSARALAKAVRKAIALYECPGLFQRYRRNAMKADFSWQRTAQRYVEIYERGAGV